MRKKPFDNSAHPELHASYARDNKQGVIHWDACPFCGASLDGKNIKIAEPVKQTY